MVLLPLYLSPMSRNMKFIGLQITIRIRFSNIFYIVVKKIFIYLFIAIINSKYTIALHITYIIIVCFISR